MFDVKYFRCLTKKLFMLDKKYFLRWVGLLAEWKQHPSLLVSLPATKALCNLDQEFGGHKYEPGIYLMLPNDRHVQHKNNRSNWGVDVVFVHGLMGGVFYTWRQFDPENVREFSNDQV